MPNKIATLPSVIVWRVADGWRDALSAHRESLLAKSQILKQSKYYVLAIE